MIWRIGVSFWLENNSWILIDEIYYEVYYKTDRNYMFHADWVNLIKNINVNGARNVDIPDIH